MTKANSKKRNQEKRTRKKRGVLAFSKQISKQPDFSKENSPAFTKNFEKKVLKVFNTLDPSEWHSALENLLSEAKKLKKLSVFHKQGFHKKNLKDARVDFLDICRKYKYKLSFSKKEKMEAKQARNLSFPSNRRDFRGDYVITIDSEEAKDLDDSIFLRVKKGRYILSIHIADVSFYVKENSALDRLARKRGNSVYLVEKVVPMLPEELSNGICSLNQGQDRLTVSLEVEMDASGTVLNYKFFEGIIRVAKRFSYHEVEAVIQEDRSESQGSSLEESCRAMLKNMRRLSEVLYQRRMHEGGIDLNIQELKISTDELSYPVKVEKIQRLSSHKLVEEFMLLANRIVAKEIQKKDYGVFRTHANPDREKIEAFHDVLAKLGHTNYKEMTVQKLLKRLSGKPEERLVNMLLLRSMKQAVYSTENTGHFALSFREYTHFTSPIRRYADLLVHRILKARMGFVDGIKENKSILKNIAEHISMTERKAIDAEREMIKRKSARFMENKVGEVFEGIVCGVTSFGLFIELADYGIEGMLRLEDLDGVYVYEEEKYRLIQKIGKNIRGKNGRNERKDQKIYELGTPIQVQLAGVQIERGFIDFVLAQVK